MSRVRAPAVAGLFYSADPEALHQDVQNYLAAAKTAETVPKALIVPHAGYIYSGAVAATAYKTLLPLKDKIHRVILLGPSHRVAFSGLAVPDADTFNTPLGKIELDLAAIERLLQFPQVVASNAAHLEEHSLEVQLPFLQEVLSDYKLVPIVVGDANRHEVAEVINTFWDEEDTLFVISSDLSHYHEYYEAKRMDRATSDAIVHFKPEQIAYDDACGRNGINGLLTVAQEKHLQAEILDLRNSGDTAGDKSRVVGYGAYAFH